MTRQSPIVEFITARLAEAERDIKQIEEYGGCCSGCHCGCADPARLLREVESKRQILAEHSITNDSVCATCVTGKWGYPTHGGADPQSHPCRTLRLLALPYSDHDDFDPAWSTD